MLGFFKDFVLMCRLINSVYRESWSNMACNNPGSVCWHEYLVVPELLKPLNFWWSCSHMILDQWLNLKKYVKVDWTFGHIKLEEMKILSSDHVYTLFWTHQNGEMTYNITSMAWAIGWLSLYWMHVINTRHRSCCAVHDLVMTGASKYQF